MITLPVVPAFCYRPVISRLENKASDARASTLRKVAQALDKELVIELSDRPRQRKRREKVVHFKPRNDTVSGF